MPAFAAASGGRFGAASYPARSRAAAKARYFSRLLAMIMRWASLVPS